MPFLALYPETVKTSKQNKTTEAPAQTSENNLTPQKLDYDQIKNPFLRASIMPENNPGDIRAKRELYNQILSSSYGNKQTNDIAKREIKRLSQISGKTTTGGRLDINGFK